MNETRFFRRVIIGEQAVGILLDVRCIAHLNTLFAARHFYLIHHLLLQTEKERRCIAIPNFWFIQFNIRIVLNIATSLMLEHIS